LRQKVKRKSGKVLFLGAVLNWWQNVQSAMQNVMSGDQKDPLVKRAEVVLVALVQFAEVAVKFKKKAFVNFLPWQ